MAYGVRALWFILIGLLCWQPVLQAGAFPVEGAIAQVRPVELPSEARETLRLIAQGGPYPYPRDGVVFGNREQILPKQRRGYYHEYTVKTPGVRHRGARRIVCGELHECYYTDDHYQTFRRIKE